MTRGIPRGGPESFYTLVWRVADGAPSYLGADWAELGEIRAVEDTSGVVHVKSGGD
eukprot:COSAG02_NODE_9036_length_2353_cov_6.458740_2_plen_56_part_00